MYNKQYETYKNIKRVQYTIKTYEKHQIGTIYNIKHTINIRSVQQTIQNMQ